jgi:hypothetical protein
VVFVIVRDGRINLMMMVISMIDGLIGLKKIFNSIDDIYIGFGFYTWYRFIDVLFSFLFFFIDFGFI